MRGMCCVTLDLHVTPKPIHKLRCRGWVEKESFAKGRNKTATPTPTPAPVRPKTLHLQLLPSFQNFLRSPKWLNK